MAIQLSDAVRQARLNAIEDTAGTFAKLRILTGTPPTNCGSAETGTLLCEIALPSDWMAAASGTGSVSKAKLGTWSGTGHANAAGGTTAGYFRIVNSAGSVAHVQGTISSVAAGTGDLQLDNPSIAQNQTVNVSAFTLNEPNG